MNVRIESSWKTALEEEFTKPYFHQLTQFVRQAYTNGAVFPPAGQIFRALDMCPLSEVRVVILGQDPYHGPNQAHGLCFSVPDGIAHPPSLINIFKELEQDTGKPYPSSGDLSAWAQQGVLLLNATLTVASGQAGSHQNRGWEQFTDAVISKVSEQNTDVVFLLWGGYAKKKGRIIDPNKHLALTSGHPSPLSANRGYWFGNKHFSRCNTFLKQKGYTPVQW
ncbi:MAG: uracil-DNA glycosylase [Flavobacteriaceae bacterium]